MEAVPRLPLISFELKVSPENTHFGPKLKQYIAEVYREDPDSYSNDIHQLEGLRSAAVRPSIDVQGLNALVKYFCQLRAMQSRFPMAKGQPAACSFAWKDLYANMSCSLADIRFEMACILYNIGALHTQLGASEPRNNPDSLKSACTHYQNAAWAFQYLREQYPQPPGVDVSTEIVRLLQEMCFAQAQECILDKSIQDTKKPTVIGAVASQVLSFYKNSVVILGPSTGTDNIHEIIGTKLYNYWYRYLSFKTCYVGCIVCLYQGMNAEEQQKMGERVAFYQQAVDKLAEARKLAKYIEPVQVTQEALTFTNDVVEGKRKAAKNENEFIYHEEVPNKFLLTELKPVCLVKALPINFNDPEVSGHDVFSRLIPMGAHEASSLYSEEKAKTLRSIVDQVEAKDTELTEFLSSMQLEQLDVLDEEEKIPQEIVDRCAAMNAKSEVIQLLVDSMNNLAEIISDVEHTLAEIKALIQEEGVREKEHQAVTGPRPPSLVQTELSRELHKYEEAHARARDSNHVLHKAVALHVANLRLLALPLADLTQRIPSLSDIGELEREKMYEMRDMVKKILSVQKQRGVILQQLRANMNNDDITAKLLASSETREDIFKQELEKHDALINALEQSLEGQETGISNLTVIYASYAESRRLLSDVLRKRDALINALITSYDSYGELVGKCQKGVEFYRRLAASAGQLLARVRSACQVQAEQRAAEHATSTVSSTSQSVSTVAKPSKNADVTSSSAPATHTPKLKDYLPYMKNRGLNKTVTPQAQMESLPSDSYYPTGLRPTPLGSEATDMAQMRQPDGVVMPPDMQNVMNPYNRYAIPYSYGEINPYTAQPNYAHPATSKAFDKPDDSSVHGYPTAYTPSQYSTQISTMSNSQYNPYYTSTQDSATIVTDSQNMQYNTHMNQMNMMPNASQYNVYSDQYRSNQMGHVAPIPVTVSSVSGYNVPSQTDLNTSFAQMQVSVPKQETQFEPNSNYGDYSQTYYSMQYPQGSTPMAAATYSHAVQNTNTNIVPSQVPSDYNSLNYPYSSDTGSQYVQNQPNVSTYSIDQYNSPAASTFDATIPQQYNLPNAAENVVNVALAELDAIDKPIKSFVRGEALPANNNFYQSYDPNTAQNYNPTEQNYQPTNVYQYSDQSNVNYAQAYQNHPGYTFNTELGNYEYSYGSQNSYATYENPGQANVDPNTMNKDPNMSMPGVYTNAGNCDTVQSPSENVSNAPPSVEEPSNQPVQSYYNSPYGYQTTTQSNEVASNTQANSTNHSVNTNQSTYMQSGKIQNTSVTYSSNQVSTTKENVTEYPSASQSTEVDEQNTADVETKQDISQDKPVEPNSVEQEPQQSAFDLLCDIDFTVKQTPLMPEIKVPQISESVIKKPTVMPKAELITKPLPKKEVLERPVKKEVFTNPSLLNKFTQEVKDLQKLVDSLTNKAAGGLTLLDSKWKVFQDVQTKENTNRSKSIAMEHAEGTIVSKVVPYDDSRVKLKSNPDAYINASYYKQLAPWCIPLVISSTPLEKEHNVFWKAVLEYKISCILCLLSEIEIQGKVYWPTAIGQSLDLSGVKVTLEEVKCTVHWTERKLVVISGKSVHKMTHYQINVFPAKIVCSPLVLLADHVLAETYERRDSDQLTAAWVHCGNGAGRSAVVTLLLMVLCQVRAGQIHLCDMLDKGCLDLCKHRTNVLEDTKYLVDAYRTVLFFVQGVLCSGTTMFNGEAVSASTVLPAAVSSVTSVTSASSTTPNPSVTIANKQKFSRESFEEMKQSGLKTGDMKDPLNFLDPLWSLKKK